jgi:hypothetical protein
MWHMLPAMVPVSPVKVARRFALGGFSISIIFLVFWFLEGHYNFFRLPSVEQATAMNHNYEQPKLRAAIERANFVLCPALVIMIVGMDFGTSTSGIIANAILWGISLVLNTGLYFLVGLALGACWSRLVQYKLRETPSG